MALLIKTTGLEEYLDPNGGAWLKMLILGEHGAGKTRSAGTGYPRPIIADCEHGLMSVADIGVPYAPITSSADMDALLIHLKADTMKPVASRQYETFVLDTIDSLQRVLKTERLRTERRDNMTGPDWGWLGTKMQGYIEKLLNLNMNVLVHVHLKNEKDKDADGNETITKVAALEGALANSIYRDFDLIGMMENSWVAEGGERVRKRQIRWHAEPKYSMLRDRSGKLPRFTDVRFDERDYQQIFDAIFGDIGKLSKGEQVTELETETDDGGVPPPNPEGGPVEHATTPRPPAKKAAKKAPAKKAAAKPEVPPEPEKVPLAKEVKRPVETTKDVKDYVGETKPGEPVSNRVMEKLAQEDEGEAAQALVESELGGVVEEDTTKEVDGIGKVDTSTGEVVEKAKPEPAASTHVCGDTKPGLTPKVEGCGTPLDDSNNAKVQIGRLKYQADLCEACFVKHKKG